MKFKTDAAKLSEALNDVQLPASKVGVAGTALVMIEARGGKVDISTTDLEISISKSINVDMQKEGVCVVNSRRLAGVAKSLPSDSVEVRTNADGSKLGVFSGTARATLLTMPLSEFPSRESVNFPYSFLIGSQNLRDSFARVHYAAATEGVHYVCMGVCLKVDPGSAKFVATDAKRISVSESAVETNDSFQVIIPSRTVERLLKILPKASPVTAQISQGKALFSWDGGSVESKLIDGEYPNYEGVLAQAQSRSCIDVPRQKLLEAIRRAIGAGCGEKVISLSIRGVSIADKPHIGSGQGVIIVSLPEGGEGGYTEAVELEFAPQVEEKVSLYSEYFAEPLSACSGTNVTLRYGSATEFLFLEQPDTLISVIAPVKTM